MKKLNIEEVKALQSSPLFQFSLGSKELFHSNFLAWLFELYPEESGKALSKFLKDRTGQVSVESVGREEKNRDLWIRFENGQELIIENKVKSLPYLEQLAMYSANSTDNQNFLLLTLSTPPFSNNGTITIKNNDGVAVPWNILTYSNMSSIISEIKSGIQNEYHRLILGDYETFIFSLSTIFTQHESSDDDLFASFHTPSESPALELLQPLRMGDLYQKLRYEAFAGQISKALKEMVPEKEKVVLSDPNHYTENDGCINISHGMSKAQGMVTVSYVLTKGLYLTVQIQGGSYRQMVQGYAGYGKDSIRVATALKAKKLWFNFADIATPDMEYPRGVKEFNTYSKVDYYRSVQLPQKATVKEVANFVVRDIGQILRSKSAIMAETILMTR
jgi:hypothetical protein